MKVKEMRNLKQEELNKQIKELRSNISEQMMTYRTKETKNVRSIRKQKKDLARLLTIRRETEEQEVADV